MKTLREYTAIMVDIRRIASGRLERGDGVGYSWALQTARFNEIRARAILRLLYADPEQV
jgi:hypothetical protein